MKQIHTQARKANRCSGFRKHGNVDSPSRMRMLKRSDMQPKRNMKIFGCQVVRTQRIFLKKDRFGAPIYRTVQHAVQRQQ